MNIDQELIERGLIHLEWRIHDDGWDRPPSIWSIYQEGKRGNFVPRRIMTLDQLGGGSAADFLEHVAANVGSWPAWVQAPRDWVAIALCTEAWMLKGEGASKEDAMEAARRHVIHQRPDRIEVRVMTAVDRREHVYTVLRERGGRPELAPPDATSEGRVQESLKVLLRTFAGDTK